MSDQAVIFQNYFSIGGSFWQKDSLINHILFELRMPITIFSLCLKFDAPSFMYHADTYVIKSEGVSEILN